MDFCTDPASHMLCREGKSDRYDVHEYLYDVRPVVKDNLYADFTRLMSPFCQSEFIY